MRTIDGRDVYYENVVRHPRRSKIFSFRKDGLHINPDKLVAGMKSKFRYSGDGKIYVFEYCGDHFKLYERKNCVSVPLPPDHYMYKKIILPKRTAARLFTCSSCQREVKILATAKRDVCDDCLRKRTYLDLKRSRMKLAERRSMDKESVRELARDIVRRYIEEEKRSNPHVSELNFIHTSFIYDWAMKNKLFPPFIYKITMKREIKNVLPEFGYELMEVKKHGREFIFKRVENDEGCYTSPKDSVQVCRCRSTVDILQQVESTGQS